MYIQKKSLKKGVRASTDVAPEVSELLFEAEDVGQLIAEITGEDVVVETDDEGGDVVVFEVGENSYTVQAEGGEEEVESCRRLARSSKPVTASTKQRATSPRPVKKIPRGRA